MINLEKIVTRYIEIINDPDKSEERINIILSTDAKPFNKEFKRQIQEREKIDHYYMITFTLKPEIKKEEYEEIEKFILKQVRRPALKIKEAYYVKEYTKKNIPHWHISIKSKKTISKNRFNYYRNKFGNIDISKSNNNSLEESLNYINKEQQSIKII